MSFHHIEKRENCITSNSREMKYNQQMCEDVHITNRKACNLKILSCNGKFSKYE